MTATAPIPAAEATPSMANRSDNEDPAPSEPAPAEVSAQAPSGEASSGEASSGEAPAEAPARASSGEAALLAEPASAERELPARAGKPGGRSRLRAQMAENPLLTFFGTVIVALLASTLTSTHFRISDANSRIDSLEDAMLAGFAAQAADIDDLEDRLDARIDKLDARIDKLDAKIDEKFGELDAKFDEMNLKLTALIAALNATEAVDAALEGQLLEPGGGDHGAGPGGEPLEG